MAAAVLLRWAGQGLYSSVWGLPFGAGLRRRLSLGSSSNGEGGGGSWLYFPLRDRDALRVHGPDTESFLLGLLTNELPRPGPGGGATSEPAPAPAHYAHFLNVQGRTLYDVILYRLQECQEEPHFLLEVDSSVSGAVQNHLKLYKIRRKVSISPCPDLSLWAVLPQTAAEGSAKPSLEKGGKPLVLTPDPRAACMGWRLIIRKEDLAQEVIPKTQIRNSQDYHKYRYQKAPLPEEGICSGANVLTEAGKPAGKYRAREGDLGIALLRAERIKDPLHIKTSRGQQVSVVPSVPDWWPQASK
ncbi:putative transferase CAF17, mitochondrial isoform X2 [Gracilinanus agilis]|uniref:putative transferase CAF17, mitochondrial isoform X2 n=1 Tax=Gracilinanus agilis TaxID=191870 RepID=UPI001CFF02AC|nr:putative transferase CAF17, mitochondrial isoform X2 [Gracilinanus agilis]